MSKDANYIDILENDKYEVLTPEGFKDFKGLAISKNDKLVKITTSETSIVVTEMHEFEITPKTFSYAKDIVPGDLILCETGFSIVNDVEFISEERFMYDLLHVEDCHKYYTNSLVSKNCLFIDEVAFIPDHVWEDFYNSVMPTISSGKTSQVIMVSTPKGMNHYYDLYKKAAEDKSNFKAIKVPWWERPDRDENWKKERIQESGQQNFWQEYDCRFLGSSNTLIDPDTLERVTTVEPTELKYNGAFRIYERPEKGAIYILGIDSAKGGGSDYSVIQILKVNGEKDITQVGIYRNNHISPEDFAQVCIGISEYYNQALMMVESNDIGELVTSMIWYDYECDRLVNCDAKGLGIRATRKTKLAGNLLLKKYMENGYLEVKDSKTLFEMSRYVEVTPNVFHAEGQNENDDCVTSLIWALYFLTTDYYDRSDNMRLDAKRIDPKYQLDFDGGPVLLDDSSNGWEFC